MLAIKRKPCREEIAFLDLIRTVELLSHPFVNLLKKEDLSQTQYNILRILRGSPDGLACGEIANRMVTRDPDITRLLDRLEKRKLISRARESRDRRLVIARIETEGLELLARMDEPVVDLHQQQLGHLGVERLEQLASLLEDCRSSQ